MAIEHDLDIPLGDTWRSPRWAPEPGDYEIEYRATNAAGSSADQLRVTVLGPEPGRMLLGL